MDDQKKDHPDPEGLPKRNRLKQLQTYNILTLVVKNRDLLLVNKPQTVSWGTEGDQRNRKVTIYWLPHLQGEQNETKKCS